MTHYGTWSSYTGSSSILLAVALVIVSSILIYVASRFHHSIAVKRPETVLRVTLVGIWVLSVVTFLVAAGIYALADEQQTINFTGPMNPIAPVTLTSAVIAFFVIVKLAERGGFGGAVGSAIVGTIAAPMIFELPFDLIVMWRTYPPTPTIAFTLLYFLPLFLIEVSSLAMLTFSPFVRLSRATLLLLASMFLIFAVWALFGFAYPATPIPVTLNVISKILAFATAISLFLAPKKSCLIGKMPLTSRILSQSFVPLHLPYTSRQGWRLLSIGKKREQTPSYVIFVTLVRCYRYMQRLCFYSYILVKANEGDTSLLSLICNGLKMLTSSKYSYSSLKERGIGEILSPAR